MTTYREPPADIISIVDAQPRPALKISPDRRAMLLMQRPALPSIAEISRAELKLAGVRFHETYTRSRRQYYTALSMQELPLRDEPLPPSMPEPQPFVTDADAIWSEWEQQPVQNGNAGDTVATRTPLRVGAASFSPDSNIVAFSALVLDDDPALSSADGVGGGAHGGSSSQPPPLPGLHLFLFDRRSGKVFGPVSLAGTAGASSGAGPGPGQPDASGAHAKSRSPPLNAVLGTPFRWCGPRTLIVLAATNAASPPPRRPTTPSGPVLQGTDGSKKRPARTYQDLLKDAHDESTFRHYATSTVMRIDLPEDLGNAQRGELEFRVTALRPSRSDDAGDADGTYAPASACSGGGLYLRAEPSPDHRFLLVSQLEGECSYLFPYGRFPKRSSVWKLDGHGGSATFVADIARLPLAEDIPIAHNACRAGRRSLFWCEDAAARLAFIEALDGGDPNRDMRADGGDGMRDRICFLGSRSKFGVAVEVARTEYRCNGFDCLEGSVAAAALSQTDGGGPAESATTTHVCGMLWEYWWKTRQLRCWRLRVNFSDDGDAAPQSELCERLVVFDRNYEDRYANPGDPLYGRSARGTSCPIVIGADGAGGEGYLLLRGAGASREGDIPFVDVFDWGRSPSSTGSGEKGADGNVIDQRSRRIFRSPHEHGRLESVVAVLYAVTDSSAAASGAGTAAPTQWAADSVAARVVTCRESTDENPNFFIRDISLQQSRPHAQSVDTQTPGLVLTKYPHPYPALRGMQKRLLKYRRRDGLELTGTLYTPPGYDLDAALRDGPGGAQPRLPLVIWAYPREFKGRAAAGQVRESPHCFSHVGWSSPMLWLTQGFAVLARAAMPIVAREGAAMRTANDTFVAQLVGAAEAAVAHVCDELGVGDRQRVAVGGHSYGAFMTAHLLAAAPTALFRCGIARSGAYNRTLTPFGFQSEERTLWENPELYLNMSPFAKAHLIVAPLLLVHGQEDENSGTFPQQSERMYNAIKGHGHAPARLVLLPKEGHGYRARESIMHMLAESHDWLQQHCLASPEEDWPPQRPELAERTDRVITRRAIALALTFATTATLAKARANL